MATSGVEIPTRSETYPAQAPVQLTTHLVFIVPKGVTTLSTEVEPRVAGRVVMSVTGQFSNTCRMGFRFSFPFHQSNVFHYLCSTSGGISAEGCAEAMGVNCAILIITFQLSKLLSDLSDGVR